MNHFKGAKLVLVASAATAATSAVNTDVIDTAGFEGVAIFGTIAVTNAGNTLKVQQGAAANLSDAADLTGTATATTTNGDAVLVDVFRPRERYVRGVITRTASSATGDFYAVLYNPRTEPVTHGATVDSDYFVSPAEGTA